MIITISGTPGSGKGTVGRLLAKKLKYRYYSIGDLRRAMARERGLTLQQLNVLGEKHAFTDKEVDQWQTKLGRTKDNMIVEGRTSFFFIPHSVKLFFTVDMDEAAKRIFRDTAHARMFEANHHYRNPKELAHGLRHRIASDTRRYRKYYGLNIFHRRHYDLVIDTTRLTPSQVVGQIMKFLKNTPVHKPGTKPKVTPKSKKVKLQKKKVVKKANLR